MPEEIWRTQADVRHEELIDRELSSSPDSFRSGRACAFRHWRALHFHYGTRKQSAVGASGSRPAGARRRDCDDRAGTGFPICCYRAFCRTSARRASGNGYGLDGSKKFINKASEPQLVIVGSQDDSGYEAGAKGVRCSSLKPTTRPASVVARQLKNSGGLRPDTSERFVERGLPPRGLLGTREGQGSPQRMTAELPQGSGLSSPSRRAMIERALDLR